MVRKKISTTVYLTEEQVNALKELHHRTRVPVAEFIRMGIDMILEKNSDTLPGQVSLFDGLPNEHLGRRPAKLPGKLLQKFKTDDDDPG